MWLIISHVWEDHTIKVYFIFEKIQYSSDSKENCDKAIFILISCDTLKNFILTCTRHNHPCCAGKESQVEKGCDLSKANEMILWQSQKCSIEAQDRNKIKDRDSWKPDFMCIIIHVHICTRERSRDGELCFICLLAMTKEPYVLIKCFISFCKSDVRSIK